MSDENAAEAPARTGLTIVTALVAAVIFNFAYALLFGFAATMLAGPPDDSAFSMGISALLDLATNFLSCLSGAAVAKRLFPRANFTRVFHAFVTLLVLGGVAIAAREIMDPGGNPVVIGIYIVIIAITILGLWKYLRLGQ